MIDSELFFVLYLVVVLTPMAALWAWSQWRDRRLRAPPAARALFRCPECIRFYDGEETAEKLPCPLCGRKNERLKF